VYVATFNAALELARGDPQAALGALGAVRSSGRAAVFSRGRPLDWPLLEIEALLALGELEAARCLVSFALLRIRDLVRDEG
jgi:hypothetical protein